MKNTAFRNSLYGGLLVIAIIIGLIGSIVYNITICIKPKVNDLFESEQTEHTDSTDIMLQSIIVDSSNSKFEVIESPLQKEEIISNKKVTEIKPLVTNTIKSDTIIEPKVVKTDNIVIDTTN